MGGDLCDLIMSLPETLPEKDVAALLIQLVSGLRACHTNGVAHRDLKPENLLLSITGVLKISDFGVSKLHRDDNSPHSNTDTTLTGTLAYLAPEVFSGSYDAFKADIWAMGCILYVLLTHNFPFGSSSNPEALQQRICRGEVTRMPNYISAEAKDLCLWLLSPRPEDRPTLGEVARHAFLVFNIPSKYLIMLNNCTPAIVSNGSAYDFSSILEDDVKAKPVDKTDS
ncbi:protein kinase [Angomonas deanei]|uniref:Protein tyrosine kinase/Protein kinase domain containing protein, putative n=1 Tax=Angomonas deanei TaxID=59799 RepID=A0A7G2CGB0_9TRYP|nr:protein kinase [Angomonas deanei]CAD2218395.1 Protein tyrosine kinase/Protein kinase domain containing protein, putative [Angomonas deanei]|eukprot:EPY38484.1 protein kinase [Angomonas deanei]